MSLSIVLPWPPAGLSPNAREHWAPLARLKKQYREACGFQARAQGAHVGLFPDDGPIRVQMTFVRPKRYHYDRDNLVARMKAGLDGLADALRVDDYRFRLMPPEIDEGSIGGFVRVQITTQEGA